MRLHPMALDSDELHNKLVFDTLPLDETPVRILLGPLTVLRLPGDSLIAALFPRKDNLEGIEWIVLSFGLSIAAVPLLGLTLNYTSVGVRLVPILTGLSIFTVSLVVVDYVRRCRLSEWDQFAVEIKELV